MKSHFIKFGHIWAIAITFIFTVTYSNVGFAITPQQLYDNVWKIVNTKYVDQTNNQQDWKRWRHKYDAQIKTDEDAYVAIDTMLASLNDPYTKFLNPKEFAEETSSIKGSLKGIGVQIGVKDGKLLVIAPMEDTPAEKAGLIAEDEIVEINGESTKGITVDKAADKISALIKCLEEKKAGNTEFTKAGEGVKKSVENLDLPEAKVFLEEFLPAYELTLDDLRN